MPKEKIYFKSSPKNTKALKIDRENGYLRDVVLCEVGEASGHGVHLDQNFINDVAEQGNEKGKISARLGHPNMCNSAMGKQIGYYENFSVRGEQAIADFKVLKAAKNSPDGGNVYDWIFDMAEERPEHIMNSIVFIDGGAFQIDDEGNEVDLEEDDWWGYETKFKDREVFIRLGSLEKSDLVEDGAATESLFSKGLNNHLFASTADQFLEENPALLKYLQKNPASIFEYAKKKGISFEQSGFFKKIASFFAPADATDFDRITLDNQQLTEKIGQLEADLLSKSTDLATADAAKIDLQTQFDELQKQLTAKNKKVNELQKLIDSVDIKNFKKESFEGDINKPSYHKDNFKK